MPNEPRNIRLRGLFSFPFVIALVVGLFTSARSILACPFCAKLGATLSNRVADADLVVYGELSNARRSTSSAPEGATQMSVKIIVKNHAILAGKQSIELARFLPKAQDGTVESLVFAEVADGTIDPFREIPVSKPDVVDYLVGAANHTNAPVAERLGFFFQYLNHADQRISDDAYKEFSKTPYRSVEAAAQHYKPEILIEWIKDPATPTYRIGLLGLLLGVCGREQDVDFLFDRIDSPKLRPYDGVDGLMAGYFLLRRELAIDYMLGVIVDADAGFRMRYFALQAFRFALDETPVEKQAPILDRFSVALRTPELCDLVIDELRKREVWTKLDTVLALYDKPSFDRPVIRRTIVRFAIECPGEKADAFVNQIRANNGQLVKEVEESLRFEKQLESQFAVP